MTLAPRAPRALTDLSWLLLYSLFLVAVSFWGCDPADAARGREPTITAAFEVACHQGETCAAPALVRLDAGGTTAEGVARPFHDLSYSWDCGHGGAAPISVELQRGQ